MEEEVKKQILKDYDAVNDSICEILNQRPSNLFVKSEHYIQPSLVSTQVSIDDLRGEFEYFKKIRDCLEGILINEKAPFRISHAPDYIKQFFE